MQRFVRYCTIRATAGSDAIAKRVTPDQGQRKPRGRRR